MIPAQLKGNVSDTACVLSASLASRQGRSDERLTAFLMLWQPFRILCEPSPPDPAIKQVILFIGAVLFKDQLAHCRQVSQTCAERSNSDTATNGGKSSHIKEKKDGRGT